MKENSNASSSLILLQVFRAWVANTIFINSKQTITLRQARTVVDLADSSLSSPLLETQSRSASMCNDVSSDRFLWIRVEHCTWSTVNLGDDLIRDNHCNTELVRKTLERPHKFCQVSLSGREFSPSNKI